VPRDNIMYSGWFGALLSEYISNTGDSRYNDQPLLLRHPDGREWRYTFSQLAEVVYRNFKRSRFTLFPCEPNWIYPLCNNFGGITLKIHDRLYGTRWWSEIEADYRRHFDNEFTTVDGRTLAIRSSRTGLTIAALTSVMADCVTAYFLHGLLPDVARRAWEIARLDFIRVADGKVDLLTRGWDAIDTGNYRKSMITTYAQVGAAAGEMGDSEVLELLRQRVRAEFPRGDEDGAVVHQGVSTFAHASLLGLFSQGHACAWRGGGNSPWSAACRGALSRRAGEPRPQRGRRAELRAESRPSRCGGRHLSVGAEPAPSRRHLPLRRPAAGHRHRRRARHGDGVCVPDGAADVPRQSGGVNRGLLRFSRLHHRPVPGAHRGLAPAHRRGAAPGPAGASAARCSRSAPPAVEEGAADRAGY
jgi:hypothetical protein